MPTGSTTKILITGATGYIGSNLLDSYKDKAIVELYKRSDSLDIIDSFKPDIIFHSAAEIYREEEMFDSNILLTYNLLRRAETNNVKGFIYIGSSSEYGRKNKPIKESDLLNPQTMYEATKGCGSLLTLASKIPAIIARPFSVYGKNEPQRRFIPKIYQSYIDNTLLEVGPGVHDFIYIDDFINGLSICCDSLLSGKTKKDIVNFGSGKQYTNKEVVTTFESILNQKINWKESDIKKEYDSTSWVCDTSYTKDKYNYETRYFLKDGLAEYIRYREETTKKIIRHQL